MSSSDLGSIPSAYFEQLYQQDRDPWKFETSDYEASKYAATIAALGPNHYRSGFEIGGSIGVLTKMLAEHCDTLLSIDVVETAQQQAIQRCQQLPHVRFQMMSVPAEYPTETFDLIVLSEVGYYWCWDDLKQAQSQILNSLEIGGQLLLVHWLLTAPTNPITGDDVHNSFLEYVPTQLKHLLWQRTDQYRLDLLERV
jgi:protein-L-isoaspartate O-methyltransferase